MKNVIFSLVAISAFGIVSCNSGTKQASGDIAPIGDAKSMAIKNDTVRYSSNGVNMISYSAIDTASAEKRPIVMILPEWWGLGDYVKNRANQLAGMGYVAMAVDLYGEGTYAEDPKTAEGLAMPFYKDPLIAKARFDAALIEIKKSPFADSSRIAVIGYCFGGAQALNLARLGENINGVVSFHGDLVGVTPEKNVIRAKILICHGEADSFVDSNQVNTFKRQMDSVGAPFVFKSYANATHAFTNPDATKVGKKFDMPIEYNAAADSTSWNDMKVFFKEIF